MAGITTRAARDGDEWVLNGSKTFTTNGVYGDLYFVSARTGSDGPRHRQISQLLVERNTPGLTVARKLDKTGMLSSDTAELVLRGCEGVPARTCWGEENRGFHQLASGLQRERLLAAALSVSAAAQALDDTRAYLRQRQAFGQPLSELQALAHRFADAATRLESRTTAHIPRGVAVRGGGRVRGRCIPWPSCTLRRLPTGSPTSACRCTAATGTSGRPPVERFARDYRLWTIAAGSSEIMREIIARRLLESTP